MKSPSSRRAVEPRFEPQLELAPGGLDLEATDVLRSDTSSRTPRILVASHQLPLSLERGGNGAAWTVRPTDGGLVRAVEPVLEARGGVWLGWPGVPEEEGPPAGDLRIPDADLPFRLRAIPLSAGELRAYHDGFACQVLWPIFHGLPDQSLIEPDAREAYLRVNRRFAREIATIHQDGDQVWIHDHHLLEVGRELRDHGITSELSFFLHTPFPPPELFFRIPWAERLMDALLEHDLLGFQTPRHVANFLACLRRLDPNPEIGPAHPVAHPVEMSATVGGRRRRFRVGAFPTGVDFYRIARRAASPEVESGLEAERERIDGHRILLGVDRLDYTKGVRHKLKAFATLLDRRPEWRGKVKLLQVVVPGHEGIPAYDRLKVEIERLVGEINGRFGKPGWVPVQYRYRCLDRNELIRHYRLADTAVVTPLEDGMNLVAKEFCAADLEESRALVLSRFAGAAAQLEDGAVLVNPWDEIGFAEALHRALELGPEERRQRMERLRATVRNEDVYHWAATYLAAALASDPAGRAEAVAH
jgi:trehalose 6-phosphate synthase/phosphatase